MNTYPENDWRNYLEHSSRSHKYISRKRGKGGKWYYVYPSKTDKRSVRDLESDASALESKNKSMQYLLDKMLTSYKDLPPGKQKDVAGEKYIEAVNLISDLQNEQDLLNKKINYKKKKGKRNKFISKRDGG